MSEFLPRAPGKPGRPGYPPPGPQRPPRLAGRLGGGNIRSRARKEP
jgi:hypothetical protein